MLVYGNSQCISQMFLESMQILGQSWSQCLQNLIKLLLSICRIPDAFGRDIEKACQSIYPLHDVFIRKVKVLKKPKFDRKFALYYFTRFIKIVWCVLVFNTASIKTWVTETWDNVKGFLTCTTSPLAWSVVVVAKTPWKNLYIKYWRNWWTEFDSSGICILMKAFQLPQH